MKKNRQNSFFELLQNLENYERFARKNLKRCPFAFLLGKKFSDRYFFSQSRFNFLRF